MWVERSDSRELVEALCRIDGNKRLDGIMNELAFEWYLCSLILNPEDLVAFGWCSQAIDEDRSDYYKVVVQHSGLSAVDVAFLNRRYDENSRFFFVVLDAHNDFSFKQVNFSVFSISQEDGEFFVSESSAAERQQAHLQNSFKENYRPFGFRPADQRLEKIKSFLSSLSLDTLREIYVRRMFLNYCLTHAIDIDALILRQGGGCLDIVEFKRKTPIPGVWFNVKRGLLESAGVRHLEHLRSQLSDDGNPESIKIKEQLEDVLIGEFGSDSVCPVYLKGGNSRFRSPPKPVSAQVVGLDLSHVRNVFMAEKYGMGYLYVLLLKPEHDMEPETFFADDYSYRGNLELKQRYITLSTARGVTHTFGSDSGSFSSRIRLQVIWKV
ncbi:hypothetical protein LG325_03310 [Marinobacter nauticus]